MTTPIRLRFNRRDPLPEGTVLVARPSRWGNPWRVDTIAQGIDLALAFSTPAKTAEGAFLDAWTTETADEALRAARRTASAAASVAMYRALAESFRATDPDGFAEWIGPLIGKSLACYCPLDAPCHADVLLELARP